MKEIFIVTHTEATHHVDAMVGGWYDSELTDQGKAQAALIAARLKDTLGDNTPGIVSSDLKRAEQCAAIVAKPFDCSYRLDERLREKCYGIGEGQTQDWLAERLVPAPDHNRLDHLSIEGGETIREFLQRLYQALDEVLAHSNPRQILVTHGYALTFLVARWIGMPEESAGFVNFKARAGGITHLVEDDHWRNRSVQLLSDRSHLNS